MTSDQPRLDALLEGSKVFTDQQSADEPVAGVTRHFTHDEIENMLAKFHQERASYAELYMAFWQVCVGYQEMIGEDDDDVEADYFYKTEDAIDVVSSKGYFDDKKTASPKTGDVVKVVRSNGEFVAKFKVL
jgi:hypothetical protein